MNLLLYQDAFKSEFVYFSESKPNVIFDGIYTKIFYSNEFFTMNGIHILQNSPNDTIIRIEREILSIYAKQSNRHLIQKIKLNEITNKSNNEYIKISGIWENAYGEIGLSFIREPFVHKENQGLI